jgi:hypothetical protein
MKKAGIIIVLALFTLIKVDAQYVRGDSVPATHQQVKPYDFWSHTSLGGNFGLQFGNYTIVALSPLLNYHVNTSLVVGAGPIYQYVSINDPYWGEYYSGSIYGGRVTAIYYLPGRLSNIFLMGEYDVINFPYINSITGENSRKTLGIPLVGGGYRQPVGSRSYFTLAALWDLSGSPDSPYSNPLILAGFDFGL